jgi:microcompartment protein CcmL/EutN
LSDEPREKGPALAIVELSSIARGHRVADAMLKRAPVHLERADPISPGKFVVLVDGDVAAVDESFRVGTDVAADRAVDTLFLPQPHAALWPALAGEANAAGGVESLGIVETTTVAATVRAADAAVKAGEGCASRRCSSRAASAARRSSTVGPARLGRRCEAAVRRAATRRRARRPRAFHHTEDLSPGPHADFRTAGNCASRSARAI